MLFFLIAFTLLTVYMTYIYLDTHGYIKRVRSLTRAVGVTQSGSWNVFKHVCLILLQYVRSTISNYYQSFVGYRLDHTVDHEMDGSVRIRYRIGNKYYIMLKKKIPTTDILLAVNEDDDDITHIIESYKGPSGDWHGNDSLSPNDMGYKSISFEMFDGKSLTINGRENLISYLRNSK